MKVKFYRLSNGNLSTLAERTITVSEKPEFLVVKDNPLLAVLKEEYTGFFSVFGKNTFSGLGVAVKEGDILRDRSFIGFRRILDGHTYFADFEFRQDVVDLYTVFDRIGVTLYTDTYADQSAKMDKLIEELEKPENVEKIGKLNLTSHFDLLRASHNKFKQFFLAQTAANAVLRETQSASSIRNKLETALRNYLNVVTAMKSVDGWKILYNELNELVKAANGSVNSSGNDDNSTAPIAE